MSTYKDTLTLYEEMVATGMPEAQAKVQAHQLGGIDTYVGDAIHQMNKRMDDKFNEMDDKFSEMEHRFNGKFNDVDKKLDEIDKDLIWMRVIGAAMIVAFLSNAWFH